MKVLPNAHRNKFILVRKLFKSLHMKDLQKAHDKCIFCKTCAWISKIFLYQSRFTFISIISVNSYTWSCAFLWVLCSLFEAKWKYSLQANMPLLQNQASDIQDPIIISSNDPSPTSGSVQLSSYVHPHRGRWNLKCPDSANGICRLRVGRTAYLGLDVQSCMNKDACTAGYRKTEV